MLILALIGFVVVFVFLLKLAGVIMTKSAEKFMNEKFRSAEFILDTGKVPKSWMRKVKRRYLSKSILSISIHDMATRKEAARVKVLDYLERLHKYFQKCPFFESQETKEHVLLRLQDAQRDWQDKLWDAIKNEEEA
jgi:hypothetical protein